MPQKKRDSVNYLMERHYTLNSNFEVTSDSLMLQQLPLVDVLPVFKGERLVVDVYKRQALQSLLAMNGNMPLEFAETTYPAIQEINDYNVCLLYTSRCV